MADKTFKQYLKLVEDGTPEPSASPHDDIGLADELVNLAQNDPELYDRQYMPIIKNLMRKRAKSVYNHTLAQKLWRMLIDNVAKHDAGHMARHKWSGIVRNMAAKDLADEELNNMENGEYDEVNLKIGARENAEVTESDYQSIHDIIQAFPKEVMDFKNGGDIMDHEEFYDALYSLYLNSGEMPYGVAKARDGDPSQWISDKLDDELLSTLSGMRSGRKNGEKVR